MNRVFLTGIADIIPDVVYTLKGERVVTFVLRAKEGAFDIDVVFLDTKGVTRPEDLVRKELTVCGRLVRTGKEKKGIFKLEANKILFMEE